MAGNSPAIFLSCSADGAARVNPTLSGLLAICMWSLLAAMTAASGKVPPLQLMAITFLVGGLAGAATWLARGVPAGLFRLPATIELVIAAMIVRQVPEARS